MDFVPSCSRRVRPQSGSRLPAPQRGQYTSGSLMQSAPYRRMMASRRKCHWRWPTPAVTGSRVHTRTRWSSGPRASARVQPTTVMVGLSQPGLQHPPCSGSLNQPMRGRRPQLVDAETCFCSIAGPGLVALLIDVPPSGYLVSSGRHVWCAHAPVLRGVVRVQRSRRTAFHFDDRRRATGRSLASSARTSWMAAARTWGR